MWTECQAGCNRQSGPTHKTNIFYSKMISRHPCYLIFQRQRASKWGNISSAHQKTDFQMLISITLLFQTTVLLHIKETKAEYYFTGDYSWCFHFYIVLFPGTLIKLFISQHYLICFDMATMRILIWIELHHIVRVTEYFETKIMIITKRHLF